MSDLFLATMLPILIGFTLILKTNFQTSLKKGLTCSIILSILTNIAGFYIFPGIPILKWIIGTTLAAIINGLFFTGNIRINKVLKFLLIIFLFFGSSFFKLIPITLLGWDSQNLTSFQNVFSTFISDFILLIILVLIYHEELKKGLQDAKKNFYPFFESSFKIWFVGLLLMVFSNVCILLFVPQAVAGNEQGVKSMIGVAPFLTFICAGLFAPVIEELTFRKELQDLFPNKYVFIISSALIFGLLHVVFAATSLFDYIYAIPYALLGGAFAYMVDKTDNITSSIMMHMIHNSTLTLISILTGMILL